MRLLAMTAVIALAACAGSSGAPDGAGPGGDVPDAALGSDGGDAAGAGAPVDAPDAEMNLPPAPLSAGPDEVHFDCVAPTQRGDQPLTIHNTGAAAVGPLAVQLVGEHAGLSIAQDGCTGQSLAPAQSCQVTLRFEPSAVETVSATLEITAPSWSAWRLPVNAQAQPRGEGVVEPNQHEFGAIKVGEESGPASFRIANYGDAMSPPVTVKLGGTDFRISADGCSGPGLPGASSCAVEVRFAPQSVGERSASLTFTVGGMCADQIVASLTGAGIP